MSYILEALKRSQQERVVKQMPNLLHSISIPTKPVGQTIGGRGCVPHISNLSMSDINIFTDPWFVVMASCAVAILVGVVHFDIAQEMPATSTVPAVTSALPSKPTVVASPNGISTSDATAMVSASDKAPANPTPAATPEHFQVTATSPTVTLISGASVPAAVTPITTPQTPTMTQSMVVPTTVATAAMTVGLSTINNGDVGDAPAPTTPPNASDITGAEGNANTINTADTAKQISEMWGHPTTPNAKSKLSSATAGIVDTTGAIETTRAVHTADTRDTTGDTTPITPQDVKPVVLPKRGSVGAGASPTSPDLRDVAVVKIPPDLAADIDRFKHNLGSLPNAASQNPPKYLHKPQALSVSPTNHDQEKVVAALSTAQMLPVAIQAELPPLQLSVHVYDPLPKQRFVIINGQRIQEGRYLTNDLMLMAINKEGIVLQFKGYKFFQHR